MLQQSWRRLTANDIAGNIHKLRATLAKEARSLADALNKFTGKRNVNIPQLLLEQTDFIQFQLCPILRKNEVMRRNWHSFVPFSRCSC
jgi:hypothetical protein